MSTTRHHHHLLLQYTQVYPQVGIGKEEIVSYPLHSILNSVTIKPAKFDYDLEDKVCGVVGSCNGLICLAFYNANTHLTQREVVLWNPSIRKFKKLLSYKDSSELCGNICGFGYDSVNDVYKVLGIFFCDGVSQYRVKIHSLGTDSWRVVDGELHILRNQWMKFVSGALNWIDVVSFDLVNESYRKLLPPDHEGKHDNCVVLGVLKDSLSICVRSHAFSTIWLMKEYGNEESWTKLFRVPHLQKYPDMEYLFHISFRSSNLLWIFEDDQVLMEYPWLRGMTVYDSKTGTFKTPMIENISDWIIHDVCVAVESLVSPCF